MGGREQAGQRARLGCAVDDRTLGADLVHHRAGVVHARLHVRRAFHRHRIRHAAATPVEDDQPRERAEPAQEPLVTRLLPDDLDVGVPRLQVDKVDRAVAQHLVCEPSAVLRPRVPRLRKLHPRSSVRAELGTLHRLPPQQWPSGHPCRNPSNRLSRGPPCETRPARVSSSATSSPPAWSSRPAPRRRADGSSTARSPCRTDRTSDGANAHHPGAALGHEPRSERTPPPIAAMHVLSRSCADPRPRLQRAAAVFSPPTETSYDPS